jgi:hypothetical protein
MARLTYSMLMPLDGYIAVGQGQFGWAAPDEEEVHAYVNQLAAPVGVYLYDRRMYETMVYWETAPTNADQPQVVLDWARHWQAAEKVVYSRTLAGPHSVGRRIEQEFDPEAIRQIKRSDGHDIAVAGPQLAGQAVSASIDGTWNWTIIHRKPARSGRSLTGQSVFWRDVVSA